MREKEEVWQARTVTNAQKMKHNRSPNWLQNTRYGAQEGESKGPEMQKQKSRESGLTNSSRGVGDSCSGLLGCKCGIQKQGRVSSQHTRCTMFRSSYTIKNDIDK